MGAAFGERFVAAARLAILQKSPLGGVYRLGRRTDAGRRD
jgi:hypothetical protein